MSKHADPLAAMRGLGATSAAQLRSIGIDTPAQLRAVGAVTTYRRLQAQLGTVSRNFLFALVGALEDQDWRDIASRRRYELDLELEGLTERDAMLAATASGESD